MTTNENDTARQRQAQADAQPRPVQSGVEVPVTHSGTY